VEIQVPTGSTTDFAGEKGAVFAPALAASMTFGRFTTAASLGIRARTSPQSFFGERQGTQALAALGMSVDVAPRRLLAIGAESHLLVGFGGRADVTQDRFGLESAATHTVTGGEWLGTLRSSILGDELSVLAGAGGTLPLSGLIGVGEARVVVGIAYTPIPRPPPPPPPPPIVVVAPPPPEPEPVVIAPPPPPGECVTTCRGEAPADADGLALAMTPALKELRACLDRLSAEKIAPVVIVRFSDAGDEISARFDLGGYEDAECAKSVRVPAYRASRAASARCELRCSAR
jgi:hypothetical protein